MKKTCSRPQPLGATLDNNGCNFSIYAPNCPNIELVLFSNDDEYETYPLHDEYAGIKYIYIENIVAGQKYGYSVLTEEGEKCLLSDPYAKALDKPLHYSPPYTNGKSWTMSKCVVIDPAFDWQGVEPPHIPRENMVLFETHVKGVSQLNNNISKGEQGKYLGLVSDSMLKFYKQQNITTLQLLPITACMHETHLLNMGMVNYWGYNPYLFMVPDPRYAEYDATTELKTAIRELHRNGIEVILDVVYNHTAEGGCGSPEFNLKILDPQSYIKFNSHFANYTGCGNTTDLMHQPMLNLVMDSLRYWVKEFHVDGFRFDLAATLGRNGDTFNYHSPFFKAVAQDPILKNTKLIAEPWDIGPNGYQVGGFPDGWNECNDKFRDITRSFWRGDDGYLKEFATRIMGSRDLYSASRWPQKLTVNYVTYHDGFTLQDLVSYNRKHNGANGEHNHDGHGDNRSSNYGAEGKTNNMIIKAIREKQKRNFMASLLFAFGIPHIMTADVLSHSQGGNNNAYCQDNKISWINWRLNDHKILFKNWIRDMLKARQQYMVPFIKAFSGEQRHQNYVHWLRPDGQYMEEDDWNFLNSVVLHLGIESDNHELLYLINQSPAPSRFKLPNNDGQIWHTVCDTNMDKVTTEKVEKEMLLAPMSLAILYSSNRKTSSNYTIVS